MVFIQLLGCLKKNMRMGETMFASMESLFSFSRETGPEELARRLEEWSRLSGKEAFAGRIAEEIVTRAGVAETIPEAYQSYRQLVSEATAVFLSRVDSRRLIKVVVDLVALGQEAPAGAALLQTARRFPTLHKLGQMMARNPHIDPVVKENLIQLENEGPAPASRQLLEHLEDCCQGDETVPSTISFFDEEVLAEASVAAVVPFRSASDNNEIAGVCKILKPGVAALLEEELAVLEEVASFFDENRERFQLEKLDIRSIFADLEQTMRREIDLTAEQKHLDEAGVFYQSVEDVRIPQAFSSSSSQATCMEYLQGAKITDSDAAPPLREKIAQKLFEAVICRPLFSRRKRSIFHGDPHAGNIVLMKKPGATSFQIGLVDWSLAGRLSLAERIGMNRLIRAMLRHDGMETTRCIVALANLQDTVGPRYHSRLRGHIESFLHSCEPNNQSLIGTVGRLLEQLSYQGIVFPAQLMLFRKAVFTLEGVLLDICPAFDFDARMQAYLFARIAEEMPLRICNMLFPLMDRPENYDTLISNAELQSLLLTQSASLVTDSMELFWQPFYDWGGLWKKQATC